MPRLIVLLAACVAVPAFAQMPVPEPATAPAEPGALPLYPDTGPSSVGGSAASERWMHFGSSLVVRNVTLPTLTPVLPDPARATGAAVVVAPGGGFMLLSMDQEGWQVARRLADRGIAAFVLKYRVRPTPADHKEAAAFMEAQIGAAMRDPKGPPTIGEPSATRDALAAVAMVRGQAARWGVDPGRVGMIGFSAGAMTTLNAVLEGKPGERPAFIGYIYGPMLPIPVPADAPPMFAALAMDDPLFSAHGFGIVEAWRAAKRPVELHAYEKGGHGFGTGVPGTTTTLVMDEFIAWLQAGGFLGRAPPAH